mmetsp:Transcript_26149/g.55350  ORF Transcript_26149/g.55350 Transcript_26149/m.55350 type:complete len:400 (-) Transcript_26149:1762-2961(-)
MDVGPEAVLPRYLLNEAEGTVQLVRPVHELHEQGECEVAWLDTLALHTLQQLQPLVHQIVLRTTVEQGVEHYLVWLELRLLLHLLEDVEALLSVADLAVALDHRAVGDEVGLDARRLHVLNDLRHAVHATAPRASIGERVVSHDGQIHVPLEHLLVDGPDTLNSLLPGEALQDRAVDHRVQCVGALLVVLHLVDELIGTLCVPIVHHRLDHATQRDACGLDVPTAHLLPATPNAVDILGVAVGLNQAAEGVRAVDGDALAALEMLQLSCEEVRLPDADACLDNRGKEDLVHGLVHLVDQLHSLGDVGPAGVGAQVLEQDRASHLVRFHAKHLHLLDDAPNLRTLCLRAFDDHAVHELVEGHAVGLQTLRAHLLHEGPRLVKVLLVQVCLDQGVVGDDVC